MSSYIRHQRELKQKGFCKYCSSGPQAAALFPSTQARYQFHVRSGLMDFEDTTFNPTLIVPPHYETNPLEIENILSMKAQDFSNRQAAAARAANTSHCCNYESGAVIHSHLASCFPHLA